MNDETQQDQEKINLEEIYDTAIKEIIEYLKQRPNKEFRCYSLIDRTSVKGHIYFKKIRMILRKDFMNILLKKIQN